MMNKSKLLININKLEEISEYKKIGYTNFLFALKDYSIGYNTFTLDEIPSDSYIFINRVMDTKTIESLKGIKEELTKFKGIIFEDLGVYQILKDTNIDLIWYQNHFTINKESLRFWLDRVYSAVLSNEITSTEIEEIVSSVSKPIILNIFGKNQIMYSRRTLLTNFNKYNNLSDYNDMTLDVHGTKDKFFARENEFGTVIFNNEYFNYIDFAKSLDESKIRFYLVMNLDLSTAEIDDIINGKTFGNDGFLNKKTVYKMSEYNDR